jgi:hypothetical protein
MVWYHLSKSAPLQREQQDTQIRLQRTLDIFNWTQTGLETHTKYNYLSDDDDVIQEPYLLLILSKENDQEYTFTGRY